MLQQNLLPKAQREFELNRRSKDLKQQDNQSVSDFLTHFNTLSKQLPKKLPEWTRFDFDDVWDSPEVIFSNFIFFFLFYLLNLFLLFRFTRRRSKRSFPLVAALVLNTTNVE